MASLLYIEHIYFLPRNALVQNSRFFTVAIVWLSSGYRVATEWLPMKGKECAPELADHIKGSHILSHHELLPVR